MNIKFFDENLIGQPGLSPYIDPNVKWSRSDDNYDIGIYTDKMCFTQNIDTSKINCAWIIEPPIINGENYRDIIKNKDKFKFIFSHHKNLIPQSENVVFIPHGGTWLRNEDIKIHDKNKLVSFIFSWKDWNPYHRMRFRVYDRFKDTNKIDFYGTGCNRKIDNKIEGLKEYMFSIVIENSIESGYFTEKILDCFLSGTIPIYVGDRSVLDFFDENGIIFFNGDEDLPSILEKINLELYNSKIESIKNNFEIAKSYISPEIIIQKYLEKNV